MNGLTIGKQLQFLKEKNKMRTICEKIHEALNSLKRYYFPITKTEIYKNGIYVLFERGESAHNVDRIVRIGTHTGNDQLPSRIEQHFVNENKDRSIFRKNIGRCILNKEGNNYLDVWEIDYTTKQAKEKYGHLIDEKRQKEIEKRVSKYIRENISFAIIEVNDKEERLFLESRLISTVSKCSICKPSENWLGLYSPKVKIRKSGLYLENELYKQEFNENECEEFIRRIQKSKDI